jgi:predicted PurR-regulated permease PerM
MIVPKINEQPFYFRLAMVLIAIIALVFISVLGKEVLSPMIFGLLFSILLFPIASFFEKKLKLRRSAASALAVIILIVAIGVLLYIIGSQISQIANDLPMVKRQVISSLHDFQQWISRTFNVNLEKQMSYVDSATSKLESATPKVLGSTVLSLSSILLFLIFVILDTFFFLFYRKRLLKFFLDVFKKENENTVYDIVATTQSIIRNYLV